ncbi:hypothetical protein [Thermodesulforhabdus norvegica]|uniref:DUF3887 domain-containing protein n=1 Tax=Thermodesulforhabdus norvegica TaxID=39841 RepID=A0A1I4R565_9BACT|nr:hypothetical protein [Thermodesulforhabdus norvegica]SFM47070.1 hypothetical protein SAMN05660836_00389 [Thermodesulforhabdus norvegica]
MRKLFIPGLILGVVLIAQAGDTAVTPDSISEYFREVAELVIKRDAKGIYERMTPEVQQKFTSDYIADFLNKTLGDIGEPISATLTGFQLDSGQGFSQVEGLLEFSKGKIFLGLLLKNTPEGFRIHYLNIHYPQDDVHGQKMIQTFASEAKNFLKDTFFETLKKEGSQIAINYVDPEVRKEVGDDLITMILDRLRNVEITDIQNYSYDSSREGILHKFLLSGLTDNQEGCSVEVVLREEKENFNILDINIYSSR